MRDIKSETVKRIEVNYLQSGAGIEVTPRTLDRVTAGPDDHAKGIRGAGSQRWRTVCKGWNKEEAYFKTTKALEIPGCGVLIQVSTQERGQVADAMTFIKDASVLENGDGTVRVEHVSRTNEAALFSEDPINRFDAQVLGVKDISTSDMLDIDQALTRLSRLLGEDRGSLVRRAIQALAERHGVTGDDYLSRLDAAGLDDEEESDA
jgi:hypothetical protein